MQQSGLSSGVATPGTGRRSRIRFFYGWVVVGSIFLALAISYGVYYSFSVFYVALLEEYGWSRAATAGVFSLFVVVLFAVTFGLGYAVTAPVGPVAAADIFGGRNFGSIFGVVNMGSGLGSALGAWLAGYIFDVTGSYVGAFAVAAASSLSAAAFLWVAAPRTVRRVPKGTEPTTETRSSQR